MKFDINKLNAIIESGSEFELSDATISRSSGIRLALSNPAVKADHSKAMKLARLKPEAKYARVHTQEYKDQMSAACKGKKKPPRGPMSDEHKAIRAAGMIGKKWYHNGEVRVRALECPDGFMPGRGNFTPANKKTKQ